jgi:uncharacterized membrane-anchored protein
VRFNARKASLGRPGVTGTARVGTPTSALLPLLAPGDIAVIDQLDLDRDTAAALVEAGVRAVVNAAPMVSGRYGNLGPEVLAEAGVVLVEQVGQEGLARIPDDHEIRVHDGMVFVVLPDGSSHEVASGRMVDLDEVHHEMDQPRNDVIGQVDALAQGANDFLRREHDLVLNPGGLPRITTALAGRPVVIVARAEHSDLQTLRPFVRDQAPALVAVGSVADDLLGLSWAPDVVVVTAGDPESFPSPDALRVATDVVLLAPRGATPAERTTVEALGVTPLVVQSTATGQDLALLLAAHCDAALIVGVGLDARLEDYLDGQHSRRASSFATRLKVGDRLVDVGAVRTLYTGRIATAHIALVVMAGFIALLAAVSVTPVGQDWVETVVDYLQGVT